MLKRISLVTFALISLVACGKSNTFFQESDIQAASKDSMESGESTCPSFQGEKCILICHIPPGNPAARHTISVGKPAVQTHIDHHGDFVGTCEGGPSAGEDANENDDDDSDSGDGTSDPGQY